jgi:hypothetical protein
MKARQRKPAAPPLFFPLMPSNTTTVQRLWLLVAANPGVVSGAFGTEDVAARLGMPRSSISTLLSQMGRRGNLAGEKLPGRIGTRFTAVLENPPVSNFKGAHAAAEARRLLAALPAPAPLAADAEAATPPAPEAPAPEAPTPAPAPEAPAPEAPTPAPAPEAPAQKTLGQIIDAAFEDALTRALDERLQQLESRIIGSLVDAFAALRQARPNGPLPKFAHPIEVPRARPPKVIVVNALRPQFDSIKRAFPTLDLRLVENRMPGEDDADLVVSLTKFIDHPLDRALRKKFGDAYVPVNGAADSVKVAIAARLQIAQAH